MPGGCYTVPLLHVHSEEAGCYGVEEYHEHAEDCSGHMSRPESASADEDVWIWVYDCEDMPVNASRSVPVCDLGDDYVEGYGVSCSLTDGQLIGATYIYDGSLSAPAETPLPERETDETMPDLAEDVLGAEEG